MEGATFLFLFRDTSSLSFRRRADRIEITLIILCLDLLSHDVEKTCEVFAAYYEKSSVYYLLMVQVRL